MSWQELDWTDSIWSMAGARTKSDRPHVVPLSGLAKSILASLPRLHEQFVFPSRGNNGTVSGFSKWKSELDDISAVEDWRLHDLRRTTATGMAKLGVPPHVVERILNHTSGTFSTWLASTIGSVNCWKCERRSFDGRISLHLSPRRKSRSMAILRPEMRRDRAGRDQVRLCPWGDRSLFSVRESGGGAPESQGRRAPACLDARAPQRN